jgi:hypothetical protein
VDWYWLYAQPVRRWPHRRNRRLYAHTMERSPLFKGGVHGAIINNLIP